MNRISSHLTCSCKRRG